MKRVFIAATRQNEGKTTTCLGLISALAERFPRIGFIKPVGQRYVETEEGKVDEDTVLIDQIFSFRTRLKDMNPIAIAPGFTRRYILGQIKDDLRQRILDSFQVVAEEKDLVVIEGTGHAGVGSVFGLANPEVARILEAKVVLVTRGGIGRPIDEIALNRCLFQRAGVELLGVILNKVAPDRLEMVDTITRQGLEQQGVRLLGTVPLEPVLSGPTVQQVLEDTNGDLLNGEENLHRPIERIIIGAMTPHQALDYFTPNVLVITPGDREDLILAALSSSLTRPDNVQPIAGLVLTGGMYPHKNILRIIRETDIPTISVDRDSYACASLIHDIIVKIQPTDHRKIALAKRLVKQHVDVDAICNRL